MNILSLITIVSLLLLFPGSLRRPELLAIKSPTKACPTCAAKPDRNQLHRLL